MKRLLKNNRGMSLMEILVALSLLMIIIVGTTPVMLQAYNGLYTAGEYTQNVYNAKTEVEDQLATRSSVRNYTGFKVNFEGLGEVATVNAKRAVSSLKNSLESLFANARVRIYISSGSIVDDNQSNHSITLQTVNLEFASKNDISVDGTALSKDGKKIGITAYLPQKNATSSTAASVYTDARKATVTIVDDTTVPAAGRIGIKISSSTYPIDFTTSPIKIVVSYLDENNKPKSAHTYLTIKTPTIIIAGETNDSVHYYTTAGVVENKDKDGNVTSRTFSIEARRMNIGYLENDDETRSNELGAASTQAVPANTVFKSVNWITEFARTTGGTNNEDIEYANTVYEPEYYVLTGTNGVIYRTYTFEDQNNIRGKVNLSTPGKDHEVLGINDLYLNTLTKQNQSGVDVMGIKDKYIVLDDRASTVVYPAVWGGDFSHIFGWSSYNSSTNTAEMGYISRQNSSTANPTSAKTWYTEAVDSDGKGLGVGQPGFYSNLASFGYYYNGWGATTKYWSMNSRKISYILTEVANSMRMGGNLNGSGSSSGDEYGYDGWTYDRIWERPLSADLNTSWQYPMNWGEAYFYTSNKEGDTHLVRSIMIDPRTDIEYNSKHDEDKLKAPVYIMDGNGKRPDNGMAQLRLKALTTLSPTLLYNRLHGKNGISKDTSDSNTDVRFVYKNTTNQSKITVTDAVYIPATSTTEAQVFYIGTVAAYGWVNQVDNVGTNGTDVWQIAHGESKNTGRLSSYWILSNDDGTTTIHKYSTKNEHIDDGEVNIPHDTIREALMTASKPTTASIKTNTTDSRNFYISIPVTTVKSQVFSDLAFTLGYTSNREMLYGKIVYGKDANGKLTQALKFCEPYYFLSHYGDENHLPNLYMNDMNAKLHSSTNTTTAYRNHYENDYYNVWFPGEMYNLTKVATKDNVTVAVGYAVAGSTYTFLNSATDNTKSDGSTGLGAIFNDGVISGMVLGQDSAFKSLLYFKDNATFDGSSLYNSSTNTNYTYTRVNNNGEGSSINGYKTLGWNYGTHARDSVQFTCVDISVVVSGDKTYYYAYYADNKGRVYRSLVATRGKDAAAATMVNYISDKSSSPGIENVSYMEEQNIIKADGTTEKIGDYFKSIKAIKAHDDLIVVAGHSKGAADWTLHIAVGVIDKANPTNAPTWKILKFSWENYVFYDMLIQDGYIYFVGENSKPADISGCVYATTLDILRTRSHKSTLSYGDGEKDVLFYENYEKDNDAELRFYAIAGKSGN